MPLTTSLTVPSPPAAMISSNPSATASAPRRCASPALVVGLSVHSDATPLSQPGMLDQCMAVYTFSKSYSMSGWRLGYAVCAKHLAETVAKIAAFGSALAFAMA